MLHLRTDGNRVYSAAIYNRWAREGRGARQNGRLVSDSWAVLQLRNVVARDEWEARRMIAERFPPVLGFVVEAIKADGE